METLFLTGLFSKLQMTETTKYNYNFTQEAMLANVNRLTNQLWKLIPMRENNEDWATHLSVLLVELSGLGEIYNNSSSFLSLLSKLEGLLKSTTEFFVYRKMVFESISLLREIAK